MKRKKLKTQIPGLDVLLNWDGNNAPEWPKELLIVLRGDRGISKVNLAMEMMIGLSNQYGNKKLPRFYSLDKNNNALRKKYEKIKGDDLNIDTIFSRPEKKQNSYLYSKLVQFNAIIQKIDEITEKLPCIVIEGFAGLSENEFKRLPMDTLEETLKKKAHTAILVFDNRLTNFGTSAEIIIEMRRSFNEQHNYTHYELQIAKNFLRTATHGWHNYRCDAEGHITVYPSLHKLLSTRQSVRERFDRVLTTPMNFDFSDNTVHLDNIITLQKLLSPKSGTVTTIVGANNTYKRRLAAMSILEALKEGSRVMIMLFNERRENFANLLQYIGSDHPQNSDIHILEIPMGCFSHDEFINMIQRYFEQYKQSESGKIHLFMIDIVALDYAFPMLQAESLFMPALTTICKDNIVNLTMVCNKKFSQIDELCFVSDTVICTERDNANSPNSLTLYLEKNALGANHNSKVYKLDITDITANANFLLSLRFDAETCTTKDFWRQAYNVKNRLLTEDTDDHEE